MAAGETFSSSSEKPESNESGSGDKKSNKRIVPVRAPLGLSAEKPAPRPETQAPTRLFDIIAEQQLREQLERKKADTEAEDSDKKKSKKNKKSVAEQAEPTEATQPKAEQPNEPSELDKLLETETSEAETEAREEEKEELVAEGAVEIALDDTTEEEIALSDRVKEWNKARPQSPPTAPMSEVGQPTIVSEEAPSLEPIVPSLEQVEHVEVVSAAATESKSITVPETAAEVDVPVETPRVLDWQPQSPFQRRTEAQPASSTPELTPTEDVDSTVEQIPPTATTGNDAITLPHNPLFAQQGVDPGFTPSRAGEAPAAPTTIERVVHHRPSDFWPGVFVGGAVEHIRHKRRERKMEKSQKLQQSRIAQLEYTQRRTALEQQSAADERLRTEDAARYEKPVAATEVFPMAFAAEHGPELPKTEQQPAPKQPSPEQPVAAEEVKPLEGHHIEKSTWHKIEVDDRTGHVAENSNIVYGEAFQRELRPEQIAAQQAQQQAEANEQEQKQKQERTAQTIAGVPTLPRPQAGTTAPVSDESAAKPVAPSAPVQRSRVFVQSGADMALWGGLVLVVLAIIAALTL